MKEGYIVWNDSGYGKEVFGVYKNHKRAERQLRKVIRNRYGHCPRDLVLSKMENEIDQEDSYGILWFEENDGEESIYV